jgi:uncharacterized membrane protein
MTSPPSTRSQQLDVFRGLAALLMVVNHAGYAWLAREDLAAGAAGGLVFLGSAAPALFFFATGVGMGMSRKGRTDWAGLWRKVALLVVADAFLNWASRRWLGLDFFAFCALSMLAVALVDACPRPRLAAGLAAAAVLALRYGDAAALEPIARETPWIAIATGVEGVPGVSYPLCPWLAFPLLGYLLGRAPAAAEAPGASWGLCAGAALALGAAYALAQRGAVVHRWNSVSFAYLVFAIGFVALAWLAARLAWRVLGEGGRRLLATRGPASLLVVPIHYAAIHAVAAVAPLPWPAQAWLPAVAGLAIGTLILAKWLAARLKAVAEAPANGPWLLAAVAAGAAATAWAAVAAPELGCWLVACLAQLAVAANLARPARAPARIATVRAL